LMAGRTGIYEHSRRVPRHGWSPKPQWPSPRTFQLSLALGIPHSQEFPFPYGGLASKKKETAPHKLTPLLGVPVNPSGG
jgi:hypothetical protein